jgi:hypothetical protein
MASVDPQNSPSPPIIARTQALERFSRIRELSYIEAIGRMVHGNEDQKSKVTAPSA